MVRIRGILFSSLLSADTLLVDEGSYDHNIEQFCSKNGDPSLKSCCVAWENEEMKFADMAEVASRSSSSSSRSNSSSSSISSSSRMREEATQTASREGRSDDVEGGGNPRSFFKSSWTTGSAHVPRKVWVFWFGAPMMGNRTKAFESLKANIGAPVELVTGDNVILYEVPEHPFHPAVKYSLPGLAANSTAPTGLSANHVVDYFRVYFMHHYGGGYHDVKPHAAADSWAEYFDHFNDTNVWAVGIGEFPDGYGCRDSYFSGVPACTRWRLGEGEGDKKEEKTSCCSEVKFTDEPTKWAISNGAYILRPKTRLTYEWLRNVECVLSVKFEALKAHPAPMFRCCFTLSARESAYPIGWTQIHGDAFGVLQYKFRPHVRQGLPMWSPGAYRSEETEDAERQGSSSSSSSSILTFFDMCVAGGDGWNMCLSLLIVVGLLIVGLLLFLLLPLFCLLRNKTNDGRRRESIDAMIPPIFMGRRGSVRSSRESSPSTKTSCGYTEVKTISPNDDVPG